MRSLLKRFDVRVSIGYAIVATLWILLSDTAMNLLFSGNPPLLAIVSVLKGWFFAAVTTLALFTLLRVELWKRDQIEGFLQKEIKVGTQTLEALQHFENRFAATFHGSPVATSISRREDAYLVDVNDAFVEMFGYQREELIGRTSFEVGLWVRPEDRRKAIKATAESGSVHNLEIQGRTKSGTTIDLLASSQAIDYGDELHIVNIFYDVTQQKKLEEQIHYQALLLENVSDAVISTDVDFNIRSWNPAAELIFGWKAEEVIGKSARELFQAEYPQSTREYVLSQLQTTGVWRGETTHRCKNGRRVHLLASVSYVYDKEGRHIGIVSVNRDITEMIKVQREKQEAAELRLEIEKQTELVRLKEDFISIVSHEFRTPLTVIMSSSELLLTRYGHMPAERQQKHFQIILEQSKYMSGLINDVLTINKARAGKLDFNPVPLDLVTFCQDMLQYLEEVVDKGKHNIIFTYEGNLSNVRMDVKLLQHILVNLLSNAIKYSPNGGDVRLDVKRQEDEVVLRVSDQGIGIPAESLLHLYEPFYRAKNTGDIGGTGLGMAIVKESVDFYKGTISIESEVGVGTTVTVTLSVV
jgi:PAS domain S-box-containing protein